MSVLTDLASAEIRKTTLKLYGKTIGSPQLLMTDGLNTGYVVDVNIGEVDVSGEINQYFKQKEDGTLDTNDDGQTPGSLLTGIPGQPPEDWNLDDSLPGHVDTTLHNVPLARNNTELRYANPDSPVVLNRPDAFTPWEVSGFSVIQPGTHQLYAVNLSDMTIGSVIDLTISSRLLTLAELGDIPTSGFGALPFGASALFKGSRLVRITA